MFLSFVPGEGCAESIYRRFGFERNGAEDNGEIIMLLDLF